MSVIDIAKLWVTTMAMFACDMGIKRLIACDRFTVNGGSAASMYDVFSN